RDDAWPVTRWEAITLELAAAAGVIVPTWDLKAIVGKAVLLLGRFDRTRDNARVPYMSAMTALDATDHGEQRSYLELADFLRQQGAMPEADLSQLWRRIVFNILVSNTDDHLRNHGFLGSPDGWRLSPAFDMNPCPVEVKQRVHVLAIDEFDGVASLETAVRVAPQFGLAKDAAWSIAARVGAAVAKWREVARQHKLRVAEVDQMAAPFEHADLRQATRNAAKVPARKPKKKPVRRRRAAA